MQPQEALVEAEEEEPAEAVQPQKVDTSSVTGAQRHAFKKALQGLPGLDTTFPPEVKEQFEAARSPSQRAAVINSVVPKDATYGWKFDASKMKLKRFRENYLILSLTHRCEASGNYLIRIK